MLKGLLHQPSLDSQPPSHADGSESVQMQLSCCRLVTAGPRRFTDYDHPSQALKYLRKMITVFCLV